MGTHEIFCVRGCSNSCAPRSAGARSAQSSPFILEDAIMRRIKQASTPKRTSKTAAVSVLGAAGLVFSRVGPASAPPVPTADSPQADKSLPDHRFVLGEEEMADVSLATFYLFDRENVVGGGVQMAAGRW